MSDTVLIVQIVFGFATTVFMGIMAYKTQQLKTRQDAIGETQEKQAVAQTATHAKIDALAGDVQKVEAATNGMKDALVKAAGEKGVLEGRAAVREEQDRASGGSK